MLDKWISKIAKKDFSETINWIEASIVFTLGLLLATAIYLDITPLTVTIPAESLDSYHIIAHQDYLDVLATKNTLSFNYKGKLHKVRIIEKDFGHSGGVYLTTASPVPSHTEFRLIIGERSILDMLLKSKSSDSF